MIKKLFLFACSLIRELIIYLWNYGSTGYSWSGWVSSNNNGNQGQSSTSQYANVLDYTTNGAAGRRSSVKVDLTHKSTITFTASYSPGSEGYWQAGMYIHPTYTTTSNAGWPTNSGGVGLGVGSGLTRSLDVSGYSGEYYIQFFVGKSTYWKTGGFGIYSVVIE